MENIKSNYFHAFFDRWWSEVSLEIAALLREECSRISSALWYISINNSPKQLRARNSYDASRKRFSRNVFEVSEAIDRLRAFFKSSLKAPATSHSFVRSLSRKQREFGEAFKTSRRNLEVKRKLQFHVIRKIEVYTETINIGLESIFCRLRLL